MKGLPFVLLIFNFPFSISTDSGEQWVLLKKSGYTGYQIISVRKITVDDNQIYRTRIRAPISTALENTGYMERLDAFVDWKQVSVEENLQYAIYEAEISISINSFLIPPIRLTSESESLGLQLSRFADEDEQVDFKFNRCQMHVKRKDQTGSTTFQLSVRGCICKSYFTGSVEQDGKKTTGLSPLYFFPSYSRRGDQDQESSIFIDRTALEKDGVKIDSLKFIMKVDEGHVSAPLLDLSEYELDLI